MPYNFGVAGVNFENKLGFDENKYSYEGCSCIYSINIFSNNLYKYKNIKN